MSSTDVPDDLTEVAKKALLKGVPYPPWPDAMLKEFETNCRDMQFTFNYERQ